MKKKVYVVILLFVLTIGGCSLYLFKSASEAMGSMYKPIDQIEAGTKGTSKKEEKIMEDHFEKEKINVLLIGVDQRKNDSGRADVLIYMQIDTKNKKTKIISIPRDLRVDIDGKMDKINHSYVWGGIGLTVDTVERFTDQQMDYYAKINMEGFRDLVNAVGGVKIVNNLAFTQQGNEFEEGEIYLNGVEALAYVRMRKEDPQGDKGRNERQRLVIDALTKKLSDFSSLKEFEQIMNAIKGNVETNIQTKNIPAFLSNKAAFTNKKRIEIETNGARIENKWYFVIDEIEKERIQDELK